MSLDERFSAWLDDELPAEEVAELQAMVDADPQLAAEFAALRSVRDLIRSEAMLAMPAASAERVVSRVAADNVVGIGTGSAKKARRGRRVSTFAAVASSFAIVVGVVGGVGSGTTLPAVGELVALHSAAAATGEPEVMAEMDDMELVDDMGMDVMGGSMDMMAAQVADDYVHCIYGSGDEAKVSVFRQTGDVDLDALVDEMDGGDLAEMSGQAAWVKDIDDWHVVVIDGDGYMWTFVSPVDMDMDSMMDDMMTDLPARDRGLVEQLSSAVGGLFS